MKLSTKQIIQAMHEQDVSVQTLTKKINSFVGMNVKTDHIRNIIGGTEPLELEQYIRLVLGINPPKNFQPEIKVIDHRKELKRRLKEQENAQDFIEDNKAAITRITRHLGGYEVLAGICGLGIGSVKGWGNRINEHAVKGYFPDLQKPKIYEYAKRIKVKLSREDWALIRPVKKAPKKAKPKPFKTSKYTGVSKQCRKWVAAICVNKRRIVLGRFDTEKEAALAWNEAASKLGRPLNEVAA